MASRRFRAMPFQKSGRWWKANVVVMPVKKVNAKKESVKLLVKEETTLN